MRGATYYLAAGSYTGHTFNDAESGTAEITIKKAIGRDHGTDAGWDPSYGDGEALFTGTLFIDTGYYTIDGQTGGGPGSWESGFGIRLFNPTSQERLRVNGSGGSWHDPPFPGHFTFRHIDFQGMGYHEAFSGGGSSTTFVSYDHTPQVGPNYVAFQYCYFHDTAEGVAPIRTENAEYFLVEYCEFARNYYTTSQHTQAMSVWWSNSYTVRYNRFVDIEGTSVVTFFAADSSGNYNNDISVYGNIFFCTPGGAGSEGHGIVSLEYQGSISAQASNVNVYNNTIANCTGGITWGTDMFATTTSTNIKVYNNLWVNSATDVQVPGGSPGGTGTDGNVEDYNTIINGSYRPGWFTGANDKNYPSGDPFVEQAADDFRLSAHTDPGLEPPAPYNVDMLGHTIARDGVWDRGALQYSDVSGSPSGSGGGNRATSDVTAGCTCNSGHFGGDGAAMGLLLALLAWRASRRRRLIPGGKEDNVQVPSRLAP